MQKNKNKKTRLVVDANAWISSLLTPEFHERLKIVFDERYHLMVSEELFRDLASAMRKPYLTSRISRADYELFVSMLQTDAELVDVHSVIDVCRDPKDNFLLALAKEGNADYLITGDDDLRSIKQFEKTIIVSLNEFETITKQTEHQS